MQKGRQELLFYRLLLSLAAPLLCAYLAFIARRERAPRFLGERLGRYRGTATTGVLWLHAASVGEFNAVLPLLERLRTRHPDRTLLLTTNTPSSARLAAQRLPAGVDHAYLPVDWSGAVRRFLDRYQPVCGLIVETEIWPNLYRACEQRGLPLIIINGRVSARTLGAPAWIRRLYSLSLRSLTAMLVRSEQDKAGFIKLGADLSKVQVVGNIKFATAPGTTAELIAIGRPYVLAASTRDKEERLIATAWGKGREGRLLVVVPRHPKRLPALLADLAPWHLAVRSRGELPDADTEIYIADTFGELGGFIAGAELVVMGGSFVPKGGQNLLEPAAHGKAVVCGPHMDNFQDETRLLREGGAIVQLGSVAELAAEFDRLLSDPTEREHLGKQAQTLMAREADVAERYCRALEESCPAIG